MALVGAAVVDQRIIARLLLWSGQPRARPTGVCGFGLCPALLPTLRSPPLHSRRGRPGSCWRSNSLCCMVVGGPGSTGCSLTVSITAFTSLAVTLLRRHPTPSSSLEFGGAALMFGVGGDGIDGPGYMYVECRASAAVCWAPLCSLCIGAGGTSPFTPGSRSFADKLITVTSE